MYRSANYVCKLRGLKTRFKNSFYNAELSRPVNKALLGRGRRKINVAAMFIPERGSRNFMKDGKGCPSEGVLVY